MPEKLIPSSSSSSPGILQMRQDTREKRKTLNVAWLCFSVALLVIVLAGFALLFRNFIGYWPSVPNSFLGSSSSKVLPDVIMPVYRGRGHSYDTEIPKEHSEEEPEKKYHEPSVTQDEVITQPSTIEQRSRDQLFSENDPVQLRFIRRSQWGAHAAKRKFYFYSFAIEKAIVLETGTEPCFITERCSQIVRNIQKADLKNNSLDDIRYNFLIGGDGSIFEGRGFNEIGQHTLNYNNNSLGIGLIGKFDVETPPAAQVISLRKLLQYGIAWEHLRSNYELFGHDQLIAPESTKGDGVGANQSGNPGVKLFEIIRKWPHWTENTFYKTYH